MEFFLPVAQVQVDLIIIIILSFCVGFISGLFGIGGGFLMTPVLIFLGIPPAFAVANEANNILGSSVSGALTHWFRKTLDYKMGVVIVCGGIFGTIIGMIIFQYLKDLGIINDIIALSYIYMLVIVGTLMFARGAKELINIISNIDRELIKDINIFDIYEGENIPNDMKSVALSVTIQSMHKTLNDKDLEKINQLIIDTVEKKTGAKIRS